MRYYMYEEAEPMAEMLNAVLGGLFGSDQGDRQQTGGGGGGCPARSSWWEQAEPCLMAAAMNNPAMWHLLGGSGGGPHHGAPTGPCGGRRSTCGGSFRWRRPEVWEETVDVSGLNPHSIEVHPAEGNRIVIQGTLPGKETAAAASKDPQPGQQVSKSVELPEGVVKRTIRCYLANGKVHISALKKPAENPAAERRDDTAQQKEGATAKKCPETRTRCTAEAMAACAARTSADDCESPKEQVSDPNAEEVIEPSPDQVSDKDETEAEFMLVSKDGHCDEMENDVTTGSHVDDVTTGSHVDDVTEDQMEEVPEDIEEEIKDAANENAEMSPAEETSVLRRVSTDEPEPVIEEPADVTTVVTPGDQHFLRKFNLSGFDPSEIKVKLQGRTLTVSAEHKEEGDDFVNYRQFQESLTVGHDIILPEMRSRLQDDGMLVITAPREAEEEEESERLLAIQH